MSKNFDSPIERGFCGAIPERCPECDQLYGQEARVRELEQEENASIINLQAQLQAVNVKLIEMLEKMYLATCYACNNNAVDPSATSAAIFVKGRWGHPSEISKDGYIACYASAIRLIANATLTEEPKP